ncbi:RNA 2',3'-cyclic phosphodiesterase [Marinobacter sp. OP 3.4]|uniref:RNA 2',3'-cyclic phosphodiesterase n=1 Tax=Marinobacter sp. OP 3.4 TaxID=3076501 RepID=UPI002E1C6E52
MPRLFLGLELPEPVKDRLLDWKTDIAGARWQRREQLHLTLCFLGQLAPDRVPAVFRAMADLESAAFELQPVSVGCFGPSPRPRTLWAGVDPEEPVKALHEEVTGRIRDAGLPVEVRPFTPHITLARFGRQAGGPADAFLLDHREASAPGFLVDRVSLFLSQTGDSGSHYQVLANFPLRQAQTSEPGC